MYGTTSEFPLDRQNLFFYPMDKHLRNRTRMADVLADVSYHHELVSLLIGSLLSVGDATPFRSKVKEDFVSKGICFLHKYTPAIRYDEQPTFAALCAEPLVVDAAVHLIGIDTLLGELASHLDFILKVFGRSEPAKGIFSSTSPSLSYGQMRVQI